MYLCTNSLALKKVDTKNTIKQPLLWFLFAVVQ